MTVDALVQLLANYPLDLGVVLDGYEREYYDLSPKRMSLVKTSLNTGRQDREGTHEDSNGMVGGAVGSRSVADALVPDTLYMQVTGEPVAEAWLTGGTCRPTIKTNSKY